MLPNQNLNVDANADGGSGASQSQESPNQQTPIDGEKLLQLLESKFADRFTSLEKNLTGQLTGLKKVQGDIDRSQNEFKNRLAELNKLTKSGMSQDEAIEALDRRDAERSQFETLQREIADLKSFIAGNGGTGGQNTVTQVFQQYGLDVKDPRVSPSLSKQYANKTEMELEALKVFHAIQTSPNPNAAQQSAMTGEQTGRQTKDISQINDPATLYGMAETQILTGKM